MVVPQPLCESSQTLADFDWNNLRSFLAIARSGRLTVAANRLQLDHTTLSRRLAALEHALKAKLFVRSPTGYTLTEQGQRLLPLAEQMESLAIGAVDAVGGSAECVEGTVRIGSPEGFGSYFLAPRVGRLIDAYPRLNLQLVAASAVFSLANRHADIAIAVSRPPAGRLVASKLTDYDLALYAAPAYLAAHPPIETQSDLPHHRFVSYIGDLLHFPELDVLQHVAPEGTTALESSNLVAQLRATRAAAGLCVLPPFLGEQEPDLVRVLPDRIKLSRSLWLIVHQDLSALAGDKAVVAFIKDAVRAERSTFQLD